MEISKLFIKLFPFQVQFMSLPKQFDFEAQTISHKVSYKQGGRRHWTVNYTGTQSFKTLGFTLLRFDWLVPIYKCPNFSTNNFNQQRSNLHGGYI